MVSTPPEPEGAVERIVSLVPSITAALIDLGRGDRVVGRTSFCPDPGTGGTVVGGTKTPQLTAIRKLEPDVVLAVKEENTKIAVDALRAVGIPVVVFDVNRVVETPGLAWILGRLTDAQDEAMVMAERTARAIARCQERTKGISRPRAAYLIWRDRYRIAGPDTYIADVLRTAGYADLEFTEEIHLDRYPEVSAKSIVAAGADVVLFSSEPFPFADEHLDEFREIAGLAADGVPALRLCRGDLVGWYPGRAAEALEHLTEIREGLPPA